MVAVPGTRRMRERQASRTCMSRCLCRGEPSATAPRRARCWIRWAVSCDKSKRFNIVKDIRSVSKRMPPGNRLASGLHVPRTARKRRCAGFLCEARQHLAPRTSHLAPRMSGAYCATGSPRAGLRAVPAPAMAGSALRQERRTLRRCATDRRTACFRRQADHQNLIPLRDDSGGSGNEVFMSEAFGSKSDIKWAAGLVRASRTDRRSDRSHP